LEHKGQDDLDEIYNEAVILLSREDGADTKMAAELLMKAADDGHSASKRVLGLLYLDGNGVDRDPKKAYDLLSDAVVSMDPVAMYFLGRMYEGGIGVEQNDKEALFMFAFAAGMGIPAAGEDADRLMARIAERRERRLRSRPILNLEISEEEVEAVCCREMFDAVMSGEIEVSATFNGRELIMEIEDGVKEICKECPFCGKTAMRVSKNKIY